MNLCPFCGAYSPEQCELADNADCPWEELEDMLDDGDDRDLEAFLGD